MTKEEAAVWLAGRRDEQRQDGWNLDMTEGSGAHIMMKSYKIHRGGVCIPFYDERVAAAFVAALDYIDQQARDGDREARRIATLLDSC